MDSSPSLISVRNAKEIFEGQVVLSKHMLAYLDSMFLKWCVDLRIPNIIHKHGKPITLHELVSILQVPPPKIGGVERLMRYLARNGIFDIVRICGDNQGENEEEEAYALTIASELLIIRGTFPCLAPLTDSALHPDLTGQFNHLGKWSCVEDLSLCKISSGLDIWEFVNKDSASFSRFNEGMASDSQMIHLALRDCRSIFEGLESIVDVGGGTGTVAKIINTMLPQLKCIVFDRPEVVENLPESNNISYVGGNMFQFIPKADAVLLKWIFHDWSDDKCIKILENCKDAASSNEKGGKIIIIDTVINEEQDRQEIVQMKLKMDILMTTSMNGRERNEEEWKKLFMNAGIKDYKISPLTEFYSIIEVYP